MAMVTLGPRGPITGVADSTGFNKGNWTIAFTPAILQVNVPQFEVYKMVVAGAANTTFNVFVEAKQWDVGIYGQQNSWDPMQPLIMRPGETLYFMYSDPVTDGTPPTCTVWVRYDTQFLRGFH